MVRIGFTGDFHLGVRLFREESIAQMKHAFDKLRDVDLLILTGDLLDRPFPGYDEIAALVEALERTDAEVWTIRGNHERLPKDRRLIYHLLEQLDLVKHFELGEQSREQYYFYLISWVPDDKFLPVLNHRPPKPKAKFNFFVFHQSVAEEVHVGPSKNDLPHGFHLIDGHIHSPGYRHGIYFTGSTVPTSFDEQWKKSVLVFEDGQFEFRPIPSIPVFKISGRTETELLQKRDEILAKHPNARVKLIYEGEAPPELGDVEWKPSAAQRTVIDEAAIVREVLKDFPLGDPWEFLEHLKEKQENIIDEYEEKSPQEDQTAQA